MPPNAVRPLLTRLVYDARKWYGIAIASEIAGLPSVAAWEAWTHPVSALILAAWCIGSRKVLKAARIPVDRLPVSMVATERAEVPSGFQIVSTGSGTPEIFRVEGYDTTGQQEVADLFLRKVPLTRDEWHRLGIQSRAKAQEMAEHEAINAVPDMAHQSPAFGSLARGDLPPGSLEQGDAFYAAGLSSTKAGELKRLIAEVIAEKPGINAAGKRVRALGLGDFITKAQVQLGVDLTSARLETVLRTNMASAQTRGESATLKDPVVRRFVPLLQMSAVHDARTRPAHAAFSGYVGTVDDFERQNLGPPLGFNCRCAAIPVSLARAIDNGWCDDSGGIRPAAIEAHNGARQQLIDGGTLPDFHA